MLKITLYDISPSDQQPLRQALGVAPDDTSGAGPTTSSTGGYHYDFRSEQLTPDTADPDAEVVVVFVTSRVDDAVLAALPRLKLIITRSTGFDHIDLAAARRRGIQVAHVPSYCQDSVAEYVFALLLALVRRVDHDQATGRLGRPGHTLNGKRLGIIGLGQIGQQVARIGRGFGMTVLAHDTAPDQATADQVGARLVGLDELLATSDVISLHTPLTAATTHLIGTAQIAEMKPGVILINTGRGGLIDTRALLAGLRSGQVAGAGLDTVEGEAYLAADRLGEALAHDPQPRTYIDATHLYALARLPGVILTPHAAFHTQEAIARSSHAVAEIIGGFTRQATPHRVDTDQAALGSPTASTPDTPVVATQSGRLVIVRHGESAWNALGKWTGRTDVHLTKAGHDQSIALGAQLADLAIDTAFVSELARTRETFDALQQGSGHRLAPTAVAALNERDYGIYTGMNKESVRASIGNQAYQDLRRGWNVPIQDGESLKQVYGRVVPFYQDTILPLLRQGRSVLVVAHGNSIRALIKYLDRVDDEAIGGVEMPHNAALIYTVDQDGRSLTKTTRQLEAAS